MGNQTNSRNWTEDSSHENGNYQNMCTTCNQLFIGHKRRVTCKLCAISPTQVNTGTVEEVFRSFIRTNHLTVKWDLFCKVNGYNHAQSTPEPTVRKSLQECKEEVAKAWQYEDWKQATNINSPNLLKFVLKLTDEAAELYASQFK